jgi:deferrochelatase/peroxidase EfeB
MEAFVAVDLKNTRPVDEAAPETQAWLAHLQGNILRGHGRDHAYYLAFALGGDAGAARRTLKSLAATYVTSALQQHLDTVMYRRTGVPGQMFGNLFVTASGYRRLGMDPARHFDEPGEDPPGRRDPVSTFVDGMRKTAVEDFGDPPPREWDEGYRQDIHAMLLLADDDEGFLGREARKAVAEIGAHAILASERGRALRNPDGEGIEHFGYVDGRSQPLFLADDFRISGGVRAAERDGSPIGQWDPFEPLERVLRPDPFAPVADCLGSLVVFRKLEQNVRAFAAREQELADRLRLAGEERDRAGALIVGRFRDGTPVVVSPTGGWHPVHDNNFTYNQDPLGRRCPMHAHIRKVNPRGDVLRPKDVATDRLRRITRRGITYGQRGPRPAISEPLEAMPAQGVGTLFTCFQSNIKRQFAFIQKRWCNDMHFLPSNAGVDPLIGQGEDAAAPQRWPARYHHPGSEDFSFRGLVTMKGGEFFFAPSLPFFDSL